VCPLEKASGVWPANNRVAACRVVVGLELGKLPFEIMGIPKQHLVEEFSTHRPDQALHEGM
jgi:hypothetical protein